MCADGTNPTQESEIPADSSEKSNGGWARRKFLGAAALGAAAAAFLKSEGGVSFGPLAAYADNLSDLNCTANDVRIVGPGIVLNEPCACSGDFDAKVQFRVINNTGTSRYCVTVHFCPGDLPGGGQFDPGDILIGDIPPKSDAKYTVTIPKYPCGAGLVCFGACGPGTDPDTGLADCSFPKGTACPTGKCCTTISWDVNTGCPSKVISSKCRHQQVCIQGRGATSLDCDTTATGVQTNCSVQCGAKPTLRACTTEAASYGPFKYELFTGAVTCDTTATPSDTIASSTKLCEDFTVGPITGTTTYTVRITSKDGCAKCASVTLTTTAIPDPTISATGPDCAGKFSLSVSNASAFPSGVTFAWTTPSSTTPFATGASAEITLSANTSTTITVTASNGSTACDKTATYDAVVPPVVTASLALTDSPCSGVVTLTATPGGGVPPYSYQYNDGASTTSNTLTVQPQLDNSCRSVTVKVTDSKGCSATSTAVSFKQCVTTTAC